MNKSSTPFQDHVDGVVVLDEVVLLFDEEVVDAGDVDVHLAEPLVLLQEGVEHPVEVAHEVADVVQRKDGFGDHVLDLSDAKVLPVFLGDKKLV